MAQTSSPGRLDRRALLLALGTTALATGAGAAPARRAAPASALQGLFADIARELLDSLPETTTMMGLDHGAHASARGRLNERSGAERARAAKASAEFRRRLSTIDRKGVSGVQGAVYDTVAYWLDENVAAAKFPYWDQMAGQISPYVLSQLGGAYQSVPDFLDSQHPVADKADADAYVSRLHAFARVMDQETARFKADVAGGVLPPGFILDKALASMKGLRDGPTASSTLVASLARRAKEAGVSGDYAAQAAAVVDGEIKPALARQIAALTAARPGAVDTPSVMRLPNGEAFYAEALRQNITTSLTAKEVHQLGLDIAAKLTAEIDQAMKAQGLTQGSVGERFKALYADPKYHFPNTDAGKEELLAYLKDKVAEVRARLPQAFRTLPKSEMFIKRVSPYLEASSPGAYAWPPGVGGSRPGAYYINLRDTAETPRWTLATLTYHEGIPGHYLQGALENESTELPLVQQILGVDYNLPSFNAYLEGWALYSEQLADELGMYANDQTARIGYLHDALFRAGRLVVDSGLHALGWSRDKSVGYFVDLLGDPVASATGEVDRYCVWPGQACSYMVGKATWLRLRDKAKAALGAKFDIRDFHDAGLLAGAMPLSVLEEVIDRYIAAKKKA